jgi:hypothetical protein
VVAEDQALSVVSDLILLLQDLLSLDLEPYHPYCSRTHELSGVGSCNAVCMELNKDCAEMVMQYSCLLF